MNMTLSLERREVGEGTWKWTEVRLVARDENGNEIPFPAANEKPFREVSSNAGVTLKDEE